MTAQQAFDARVEQKINEMMPYLVKMAGNDDDLIQEGAIGIWESMAKEPDASNAYYANKAKWNILNKARGVGRSVDTPTWYKRKWPVRLIHINAVQDNTGKDLSEALLPSTKRVPMDEYVIEKIDLERFTATLSLKELGYLHLRMVGGMTDKEAAERMDVSLEHLKYLKKGIRRKVENYYSV